MRVRLQVQIDVKSSGRPSVSTQVVPAAEEITQNRIQPAAKMVAEQAVPTAKEFTEGQLKPAAQAVAENVRMLLTAIILARRTPGTDLWLRNLRDVADRTCQCMRQA